MIPRHSLLAPWKLLVRALDACEDFPQARECDGNVLEKFREAIEMAKLSVRTERLHQALEAARTFHPLSEDQLSGLLAKTRDAARTGQFEPFKTSAQFDGTAQNPAWMA